MHEEPPVSSIDERLKRLERTIFWHRIGWCVLLVAFVAWLIPPIGGLIGFLIFVLLVGGGMVVFITSIICLLDWLFSSKPVN